MNEKTILEDSYPALEVSDDLRTRVQRLAAQSDDARASRTTRKTATRRMVLAGAMAGVGIAGVTLGPRVATAAELWRVQNALGKLKSAHIIQWQRDGKGGRENMETWFSGNSSRVQRGNGSVQIFDGIYNYFYSPDTKKVVRKAAEGPYAHNPSGFTVDAIKRDMAGMVGWNSDMERLGATREGGKTLEQIAFYHTEPAGKIRHILLVDPNTRLPQRMEIALQEKTGAWTPIGGGELRYNETLPQALFSPEFPGATLVDADALRKSWQERIETVVAETQLGERTVKIRDVQGNSKGAIFVLYTCDKTWEDGFSKIIGGGWMPDSARDWDVRIPGYKRMDMQFGDYYNDKEKLRSSLKRPILKDGGRLQGDWFIPIADTPALPAQVKIEWLAHPRNLHGDELARESGTEFWTDLTSQERERLRREKEIPARLVADRFQVHKGWTARASLSVEVAPSSGGFAPEYWPYIISEYSGEPGISAELQKNYTDTRQMIHQDKGY